MVVGYMTFTLMILICSVLSNKTCLRPHKGTEKLSKTFVFNEGVWHVLCVVTTTAMLNAKQNTPKIAGFH